MEFTIETTLPASPQEIYEAWLDSAQHSKMTGGEALITKIEGEEFSAWDGYISGKNLELTQDEYIKQSWWTTEFSEGQGHSIVEIHLQEDHNGHTLLKLHHSQLSDNDLKYKKGWEEHYFEPMLTYFSEK